MLEFPIPAVPSPVHGVRLTADLGRSQDLCRDKEAARCDAQEADTIAKGECAKVAKGTDATIQAGSHSFDWVRVRVVEERRELWTSRALVLD